MKYVVIAVAIIGLATAAYFILPYGLKDFQVIKAINLKNEIRSWHSMHDPTNFVSGEADKFFAVSTNISDGSNTIKGVMMLESPEFQQKGCLVGTTDGQVYWYDGKTAKLIKPNANQSP